MLAKETIRKDEGQIKNTPMLYYALLQYYCW